MTRFGHRRPSYGLGKKQRHIPRSAWLLAATLVVLAGMTFAAWHYIGHRPTHPLQLSKAVKAAAPPAPAPLSSHIMLVGDVFWGRAIQTHAERNGGPDTILRGLTADDKKGFDAWIGDMECPVTDRDVPYQTQVDNLIFNCRPEYTPFAAKWFDVMTLANNHTDNNGGSWGLEQTRSNLEKAGIQYFGTYDLQDVQDLCEVVAMPAHDASGAKFSMPVAMCGFDYVGNVIPAVSQMEQMKTYAKVMPVIAMPHMGVEYRATAEQAKVDTYHMLIDNGADYVVGAHPHVVQNSEVYKGRVIVYSVGNFLFDQQILGRDTTETLGAGLTMTVKDPQAVKAYEKVGPVCKAFKDDCLAQLQHLLPARPPIQVSYDFSCYDESSGTPVKASPDVCNIIKDRATISGLTGMDPVWH